MLKISENPPLSWPEAESVGDFTGPWRVAHTKSRNEKTLAHELINKEISYFLPMAWKDHRRSGRKFRCLLPLFGGYLFFCGDEQKRLDVLRTNRVANIIEVANQDRLVGELLQIEKALKSGMELRPHRFIKSGQMCRITAGSLKSLEGFVVKTKGATHLVLQVDMLGQATSVEINTDLIETLD